MTFIKNKEHLHNYINSIIRDNPDKIDQDKLMSLEMYEGLRNLGLLDAFTWEIRTNPTLLHENEYLLWRQARTKLVGIERDWRQKNATKEFLDKVEDLKEHPGIYTFYNIDNICLYVGVSISLGGRILSSYKERFYNYNKLVFLRYLVTNTASDAHVYESVAIAQLKPVFNTSGKFEDELSFKFDLPELSESIQCNSIHEEEN